jgi:hypothetical protein
MASVPNRNIEAPYTAKAGPRMRFRKTWWGRIVGVACATLIVAPLVHLVSHRPFMDDLVEGVAIMSGVILFPPLLHRYLDSPKQPRPQITAAQQPPKTEEQDASGG